MHIPIISRTFLIILLTAFAVSASAKHPQRKKAVASSKTKVEQADFTMFNTLLPIYFDAYEHGRDYTSPLTGIVMEYGSQPEGLRAAYRRHIVDSAKSVFDMGQYDRTDALISLYNSFRVTPSEPYAQEIFAYLNGAKKALMFNDSIALKQSIALIEGLPVTDSEQRNRHLAVLNNYLRQIREFIPTANTLSGTWLADYCTDLSGYPLLVFDIIPSESKNTAPIFKCHYRHACEINYGYGQVFKTDSALMAQEVVSYGTDSIYVAWSNEKMNNPSPELNTLFRSSGLMFGSTLGQSLALSGGSTFVSSLAGSLAGDFVGMGINAIANEIFASKKKSILLQLKLKKINDRQMEGEIYFSGLKLKNGNIDSRDSSIFHTFFTKIEPSDSIIFWNHGKIYTPSTGDYLNKDQGMKSRRWERKPENSSYDLGWATKYDYQQEGSLAYNKTSYIRQVYLTNKRLMEEGVTQLSPLACKSLAGRKNYIGISLLEKKKEKEKEKEKDLLIIDTPVNGFPAHMAGMKKKDIITHVNGISVKKWQELTDIIEVSEPYQDIEVTFLRNNKKMTVTIQPVLF